MLPVALVSLAFSAWMAFTLYTSLRQEPPAGWRDYASTVWIASGTLAGIVTAIAAITASLASAVFA